MNETSPNGSGQTTAERLANVKADLAGIRDTQGNRIGDVTLIAISKTQPPEAIEPALAAGHRDFGENRIQEAQSKWPVLKQEYPDICLHLVGQLQTNKVRDALRLFDVIHTVDRPKLAAAIAREAEKTDRAPECFVQVNTGEEEQKGGVLPQGVDAFVTACRDEYGLPVIGLMCIPPLNEDPALHFALLKKIAARNGLDGLSMGMSSDFMLAAEMGATHLRVGTAIFGPRMPR